MIAIVIGFSAYAYFGIGIGILACVIADLKEEGSLNERGLAWTVFSSFLAIVGWPVFWVLSIIDKKGQVS